MASPWNESQLRKYDLELKELPRMSHKDKRADELIAEGQPVILTDTELVGPAKRWTLDYLRDNMGEGSFSVYQSKNHIFKYYDEKKVSGTYTVPMARVEMKFGDFCDAIQCTRKRARRLYLQQSLNDTVGPAIVADFVQFNWKWANGQQQRNNWGALTSNLLLISEEGNVTPCHYDEQENLFCQVQGYKRVILFPPSQFDCLYPYPVYHPYDRQCQVDFENPDFEQFPKFRDAVGLEAVLGPGDVLYLPCYWFHHFETLMNGGPATSITFWYKSPPVGQVQYPLKPTQKNAMMRNIEKMITEALNNTEEVGPLLETMVLGRYTRDYRGVCSKPT